MKLLVEFDVDADLIEVPEQIVAERELYRKRFWKWLSNRSIRHKYWVEGHDSDGNTFTRLQYRSDAFVEWLNNKVLKKCEEKASVVATNVDIETFKVSLPYIYF